MEDPDTPEMSPIKICGVVFRIRYAHLTLRELAQICAILLSLLCVISVLMLYIRAPVMYSVFDIRLFTVVASFSVCMQHVFSYLNLIMSGWGSSTGRFWCDVKIMIVRGFNTFRTVARLLSSPMLYIQLAYLLGCNNPQALLFLTLIVVLIELHLGLSENRNQYDVQTHEKFISDDNMLLLEQVSHYQQQYPLTNVSQVSFTVYAIVNMHLASILLVFRQPVSESVVFTMPIVTLLIVYCTCLPILTHLIYLKGAWTFCEYEIYRSLADVFFLTLLTLFTFV